MTTLYHSSKSLVLYHASCADGFTAAWAAWKVLGDDGTYRPVQYGHGLPFDLLTARDTADDFLTIDTTAMNVGDGFDRDHVCYKNIYVLDFSFTADELRQLTSHLHSDGKVILLDHHKSAVERLQPLVDEPDDNITLVFDMEKSGARLAWEHFHPGPAAPPPLVLYVEDRDLWRHEAYRCHAIRAYSETVPFEFDAWQSLSDDLYAPDKVADQGEMMLRYRDTKVKLRAGRPGYCRLDGHVLPCVNDTHFASEIGNLLSQDHPAAVIFFVTNWGKVVYSLRSSADNPNHLDVSEIAKKFGGGGHKHAAGFSSNALPMFVKEEEHQ